MQTFIAFLLDEKPSLQRNRVPIVILFSLVFFTLGLSLCTNGGIHLFTVLDDRCTSSLLFLTLLEIGIISFLYGLSRFFQNLEEMGVNLPVWLKWVWRILLWLVSPLVLAFITVVSWIDYDKMDYSGYVYPTGIQALGWIIELLPLFITFLFPFWSIYSMKRKTGKSGKALWTALLSTTHMWDDAHKLEEKDAAQVRPVIINKIEKVGDNYSIYVKPKLEEAIVYSKKASSKKVPS